MGHCDSSARVGSEGGVRLAGEGAAAHAAAGGERDRDVAAGFRPAFVRDRSTLSLPLGEKAKSAGLPGQAGTHKSRKPGATIAQLKVVPKQSGVARTLLLFGVSFYRVFLSHFFGGSCKFYPSCSVYAQEAIAKHGARRGSWLALRRLLRCRPFTKGGFDPVPEVDDAEFHSGLQTKEPAR
jgi:putative membrane protein insertion efficiency factor